MALTTSKRLAVGIVTVVVYSVVSLLVATLLKKYMEGEEDFLGSGDNHTKTIRSCVSRPSGPTFEQIGGLESVKRDLRRSIVTPLSNPSLFFKGPLALRPPRGVLLSGPPGTGKTMLAKAVASESRANMLTLSSSTLESKYFGDSSKIVKKAFEMARGELQPCIVFFDEIDGIGRVRNEMDQACTYTLKTELLRNLDGEGEQDSSCQVVVLACTNCASSLDPALKRRLPKVLHVDVPSLEGRVDILRRITEGEAASTTLNSNKKKVSTISVVAEMTEGFTGSDLRALYSEASSLRYHDANVEEILRKNEVKDGDAMMRMIGKLEMRHWEKAIQKRDESQRAIHSSNLKH